MNPTAHDYVARLLLEERAARLRKAASPDRRSGRVLRTKVLRRRRPPVPTPVIPQQRRAGVAAPRTDDAVEEPSSRRAS